MHPVRVSRRIIEEMDEIFKRNNLTNGQVLVACSYFIIKLIRSCPDQKMREIILEDIIEIITNQVRGGGIV